MMMALTRNIPRGTSTLKGSLWEKKNLQGRELFNKVLGVIGFGNIGSIVASLAQGLRMQVIIYDPAVTAEHIENKDLKAFPWKNFTRDLITSPSMFPKLRAPPICSIRIPLP